MIAGTVLLVCHLMGSPDPWDDCVVTNVIYETKEECEVAKSTTIMNMEEAGLSVDGIACVPLLVQG